MRSRTRRRSEPHGRPAPAGSAWPPASARAREPRPISPAAEEAATKKELDGSVVGLAIADFDKDGKLDLAVFEGAASGLLGQDDLDEAGSVLEPGSSAGILVQAVLAALDAAEATEARA